MLHASRARRTDYGKTLEILASQFRWNISATRPAKTFVFSGSIERQAGKLLDKFVGRPKAKAPTVAALMKDVISEYLRRCHFDGWAPPRRSAQAPVTRTSIAA